MIQEKTLYIIADTVVRCAGKMTYIFNKEGSEKPVVYNKEDLLNPWFVVN